MQKAIPKYVPIQSQGNGTLLRDTYSMGVLNLNKNAYKESQVRHQLALQKIAEDRRKNLELNTLRKEVDELKQLVQQMLEKK